MFEAPIGRRVRARPPGHEHRRAPRRGATQGPAFFCLLFFAGAKKSESPRGEKKLAPTADSAERECANHTPANQRKGQALRHGFPPPLAWPAIAPCMGNGVRRDEAMLRLFLPHRRKGEGDYYGRGLSSCCWQSWPCPPLNWGFAQAQKIQRAANRRKDARTTHPAQRERTRASAPCRPWQNSARPRVLLKLRA
jgi:hypothetical protein